jgi:hypothetical protein
MNVIRVVAAGLVLAGGVSGAVFGQQRSPVPVPPDTAVPVTQPGLTYYMMTPGGFSSYQPQATQLAQQYAKATKEDEKKDIRKKLTDVLAQQFDQHAQEQQKELEELEKQIVNLKALLKKRQDAKSSIVERRLEQLIQDVEGLGWNAPGTPRTVSPFGAAGYAPAPHIMRPSPPTAPAKPADPKQQPK